MVGENRMGKICLWFVYYIVAGPKSIISAQLIIVGLMTINLFALLL